MKFQQPLLPLVVLLAFTCPGRLAAADPAANTIITYQGRVTVNGSPFSGAGLFKFALVTTLNASSPATATATVTAGFVTGIAVTAPGQGYTMAPAVTISGGGGSGATATAILSGGSVASISVNNAGSGYTSIPTVTIEPPPPAVTYTTLWSNDGSSMAGSEPATAVNVSVTNGLFTVGLGDTSLANMGNLDAAVLAFHVNQEKHLHVRVWFNDGVNGFSALNPVSRLTESPYAAYSHATGKLIGTLPSYQLPPDVLRNSGTQFINAEDAVALRGPGSGPANLTYMSFRDADGVRIGYVGDGSAQDRGVHLASDDGDVSLWAGGGKVLTATAGGNVSFLNLAGVGWGDRSVQLIGNATPGATYLRFHTGDAERMRIDHAGNVGIGATVPGFTLHVNGSAGKPGGGSWSVASDERLKKNIRPLSGALDKLLALHGVSFEYTDPEKINELKGERTGLVAQEVEKVFPDWVETAPDGYKRVTVRGLEALVVEALRQLRAEKDAEIDELRRTVLELKSLVNRQNDNAAGGAR